MTFTAAMPRNTGFFKYSTRAGKINRFPHREKVFRKNRKNFISPLDSDI